MIIFQNICKMQVKKSICRCVAIGVENLCCFYVIYPESADPSRIRNGNLERLQNNNYDHAHMQSLTLGALTSVEGTCMDHFLVDFMSTLNPLILQYTIFFNLIIIASLLGFSKHSVPPFVY